MRLGFVCFKLLCASDLIGNLSSEVLFFLLDALTLDVVNSIDELDRTTQLLSSVSNVAGNVALEQVGADEVLLQQALLLVESSDLTSSDLLLNSSFLTFPGLHNTKHRLLSKNS